MRWRIVKRTLTDSLPTRAPLPVFSIDQANCGCVETFTLPIPYNFSDFVCVVVLITRRALT